MKNFTPSSLLLVVLLFWMNTTFAQISEIEVSINWTSWASDNAVSIYDANDNLLLFVCDPSGCQITASNSSYSTTINLGCHLDGTGYYLVAKDAYGDGWNGTSNYVRISVAGNQVVDYDLTGVLPLEIY